MRPHLRLVVACAFWAAISILLSTLFHQSIVFGLGCYIGGLLVGAAVHHDYGSH